MRTAFFAVLKGRIAAYVLLSERRWRSSGSAC